MSREVSKFAPNILSDWHAEKVRPRFFKGIAQPTLIAIVKNNWFIPSLFELANKQSTWKAIWAWLCQPGRHKPCWLMWFLQFMLGQELDSVSHPGWASMSYAYCVSVTRSSYLSSYKERKGRSIFLFQWHKGLETMLWSWNPSGFSMTKHKHAVLMERGVLPIIIFSESSYFPYVWGCLRL